MRELTLNEFILNFSSEKSSQTVLTFLDNRGKEIRSFTYSELKKQCLATAGNLIEKVGTGKVVLLPEENQPEFVLLFLSCLLAGCIPVPLPPIRQTKGPAALRRLTHIIREAEVDTLLVPEAQAQWINEKLLREKKEPLQILSFESCFNPSSSVPELPQVSPTDIAYIQYTSGSTSAPKGVVLRHRNVISNLEKMTRVFQRKKQVRVVGWLPFYHDMGLVGHLFTVLYNSGFGAFMPAESFLADPSVWMKALSDYGATDTAIPNFAL
jgi:acyl-CoA synthetase (AMP-forming)/AMP-acid ligase II